MADLHRYGRRLKCIKNLSQLNMWGNYNTDETVNLVVAFDKCDPKTSAVACKSDSEIEKWLQGKYFIMYYNEK